MKNRSNAKKRIISVLLALILVLACGMAQADVLRIVQAHQVDNVFTFHLSLLNPVNQPIAGEEYGTGAYQVRISGKEGFVPGQIVTDMSGQQGVHYIFLVDVSSNLSDMESASVRKAMKKFVGDMGPLDHVSIYTCGDTVGIVAEHANDRAALENRIDSVIGNTTGNAFLSDGINHCLQAGNRTTYMNPDGTVQRTALIVVSRGVSASTSYSGYSSGQAGSFPVYAVALEGENANHQSLIQLCETSGGVAISSAGGQSAVEDALGRIQKIIKKTYTLVCPVNVADYFGIQNATWEVTLNSDGKLLMDKYILTTVTPTGLGTVQGGEGFDFADTSGAFAQAVQQSLNRPLFKGEDAVLGNVTTLSMQNQHPTTLQDLNRMPKLESLAMVNCGISDLSQVYWGGMTRLSTLNLSLNPALNDVTSLGTLPAITSLNLSGTGIQDLEWIKGLENLQEINISGTAVTDVKPLASLERLRIINISNTRVKNIGSLKDLEKSGCVIIRDGVRLSTAADFWKDYGLIILGMLVLAGGGVAFVVLTLQKEKQQKAQKEKIQATTPRVYVRPKKKPALYLCFHIKADGIDEIVDVPVEDHTKLLIGRQKKTFDNQPVCDLCLENVNTVARRHCMLELRYQRLFVTDMGSENGTYVNREKVLFETPLKPGDIITMGRAKMKLVKLHKARRA